VVEDLASHGYVVVTIDHTYEAELVEFPGGRLERNHRGAQRTYIRTSILTRWPGAHPSARTRPWVDSRPDRSNRATSNSTASGSATRYRVGSTGSIAGGGAGRGRGRGTSMPINRSPLRRFLAFMGSQRSSTPTTADGSSGSSGLQRARDQPKGQRSRSSARLTIISAASPLPHPGGGIPPEPVSEGGIEPPPVGHVPLARVHVVRLSVVEPGGPASPPAASVLLVPSRRQGYAASRAFLNPSGTIFTGERFSQEAEVTGL
jgi:hypothetical protein